MFFALSLLAGLIAADTAAAPPAAPGARVAPGALLVHHQPAIPIVALRMSILADDPPGHAGAAFLFQQLALPRLRDAVQRVGGSVQVQRNSDAAVYTLTGPAAELEYLGSLLRGTLTVPSPSAGEMVVAERRLQSGRLQEWEIAANHVRAYLRSRIFPEDLPPAGTLASGERMDASALRALWGEMYHPSRVSIVAVGDVSVEQVRAAIGDLPAPPRERLRTALVDTVPVARLAPPQATRGWFGIGYAAGEADAAALTVTARLLGDALRERLPTSEVHAEHWWTHHGQALAVVLAAPDAQIANARRTVGTGLTTLQQNLSESLVESAAIAARREMLFFSRTPERMAELVGSFADRTGDPGASQRFYDDLARVRVADVERVIAQLARRTPVRIELSPQQLDRR